MSKDNNQRELSTECQPGPTTGRKHTALESAVAPATAEVDHETELRPVNKQKKVITFKQKTKLWNQLINYDKPRTSNNDIFIDVINV